MSKKAAKGGQKEKAAASGKLSLYPLSIEDALRAAAQTGRPPVAPKKPKRQRKKRSAPG